MGTWGHRSFQNDGALDWLRDLEAKGIVAIRHALRRVARAKPTEYIDVDDAQPAIAAAEVVAAARGHGIAKLPVEVTEWLDASATKVAAVDAALACKAVTRALVKSELQELWNGDRAWKRAVDNLLGRLAATSAARPKPKLKKPARAKRRQAVELEYRLADIPMGRCAHVRPHGALGARSASKIRTGGGTVFAASCSLDDVEMLWVDASTLEIRYPENGESSSA